MYNPTLLLQMCEQHVGEGDGGNDQHQEEGGRGGCLDTGE